ncbi:hypothetical protein [Roseobacter sp. CCS2]|uniref:hypothetical protein n=1 Tax=Roseobacter sp. CCS2 TaxID=391593 RepID=UPI0000F3E36F|nr:hypothetical protein [Roseobacter sp. CCS2]EBA12575.1 hypothetical protein RCCS2_14799 [Roseobacter sp. CCS2]
MAQTNPSFVNVRFTVIFAYPEHPFCDAEMTVTRRKVPAACFAKPLRDKRHTVPIRPSDRHTPITAGILAKVEMLADDWVRVRCSETPAGFATPPLWHA